MIDEPAFVWKVDGTDFTDCIAVNGLKWEKNDVDDEQSGRPRSLTMRRKVLGKKRKLSCKCVRLSYTRLNQLAVALDKTFVEITYLDPILGVVTKTFYGTSISATSAIRTSGKTYFDGTAFDLVER